MRTMIEGLHNLGDSNIETRRFVEDVIKGTMTKEEKEVILRKLDNALVDTVLKFRLKNQIINAKEN